MWSGIDFIPQRFPVEVVSAAPYLVPSLRGAFFIQLTLLAEIRVTQTIAILSPIRQVMIGVDDFVTRCRTRSLFDFSVEDMA